VTKAISIRLDADSERALSQLEASGMNRSEAIRAALVASAQNLQRRQELAAEVAALEADETDRVEMLEVASMMESLRAQG
jgi:Arc/MetJ-type ribon-helix-helix transcriptional regulator